jgi:hypothetical protein
MYEGSMYGAGVAVFAVWGYVIARTQKSSVELNPKKVTDTLGGTLEEITSAIEYLTKPDPKSRFKEYEGRRLIKEGEFQYFVPSYEHYRSIRNADERREYNRLKQADYRQKKSGRSKRSVRDDAMARERRFVKAHESGDDVTSGAIAAEGLPVDRANSPV